MHDFYVDSINVHNVGDPQTCELKNIEIFNLQSNNGDGTLPGNNISGTDSAFTIQNHFSACPNNRIVGSFKARKYIFPREDKKHPGYFEGKHTDREKLEYFMNTSCSVLNVDQ